MRVLIGCEFSGIVRDAFRTMGHDAVSCDLLPSEREGSHVIGSLLDILNGVPVDVCGQNLPPLVWCQVVSFD